MTQDQKPQETEEKEPIRVSFSLPQITGGALAAATAAAIGSQLGVAGTIIGAMVASIIGGVAGTLYSAGIDRTHRKVSEAITRGYDQLRSAPHYDPDAVHALDADASPVLPGLGDTQPIPVVAEDTQPVPDPDRDDRRRKLWKRMGLSAAVIFLLALVAITVVELGLGRALNGGGDTTIGQVVRQDSKPTPTPTPKASQTVTPSVTPTPSATDQPTITPTATPTVPDPTPTVVPSATVTVTTEPTAATTP